jgi:hypothetical protein
MATAKGPLRTCKNWGENGGKYSLLPVFRNPKGTAIADIARAGKRPIQSRSPRVSRQEREKKERGGGSPGKSSLKPITTKKEARI